MNTPTYQQQERLIHEAYIKEEIRPYNANFCFCGTLSPTGREWLNCDTESQEGKHFYTFHEYNAMEAALLNAIDSKVGNQLTITEILHHEQYEDGLFEGMVNALEVLKQIHIEKGEIIQSTPYFEKRKLINV